MSHCIVKSVHDLFNTVWIPYIGTWMETLRHVNSLPDLFSENCPFIHCHVFLIIWVSITLFYESWYIPNRKPQLKVQVQCINDCQIGPALPTFVEHICAVKWCPWGKKWPCQWGLYYTLNYKGTTSTDFSLLHCQFIYKR